jgi:hypothetical protein
MKKLALLLFLLASCKSKDRPIATEADASPTPAASAPTSDAALTKSATDEDKQKFTSYRDALARGRKATIARNYVDAVKAFDEALAIRPDDSRALGEKGYALHLSGDYQRAARNLERATRTSDTALASQVWFNLGLVLEAEKLPDEALIDFWMANKLHPSTAAQAKIAGRPVCPVRVESKRSSAAHATGWRDVVRLMKSQKACGYDAKTDADAKDLMLRDIVDGPAPGPLKTPKGDFYVVRDGELSMEKTCASADLHILQVAGADFWLYPPAAMGAIMWGRPVGESLTVESIGSWIVARRVEAMHADVSYCTIDGGEPAECTDEPGETFAYLMKLGGKAVPQYTDHVLDADSHVDVMRIDDNASGRFSESGTRMTSLVADGSGLKLEGFGCGRQFSRGDGGL